MADVDPNPGCVPGAGYELTVDQLDPNSGCATIYCGINSNVVNLRDGGWPAAVSIAALECVHGSLMVRDTDMGTLDASGLTDVGDDVVIDGNTDLTSVDLSTMTQLGQSSDVHGLVVTGNPLLEVLELDNLATVYGDFRIEDNDQLDDLDGVLALQTIEGGLSIRYNQNLDLPNDPFDGVTYVGESVDVIDNDSLVRFVTTALASVSTSGGTGIRLDANPSLTTLDFSSLATLDRAFTVVDNAALADLGPASPLTAVGDDLHISNNPSLTNVDELDSVLTVGGDLIIEVNTALTSMAGLAQIQSVGLTIVVTGTDISALDLGEIDTADSIRIRDNDSLTSIAFDDLTDVTSGYIRIFGNAILPDIGFASVGFPSLQSVNSYLYIQGNESLEEIRFPALDDIGTDLFVRYNDPMSTVEMPGYYDPSIPTCVTASKCPGTIYEAGNSGACTDLTEIKNCCGSNLSGC